ncbi:hypothetical protein ABDK56_02550 [Sphingomonas sp. ASV193]|uniref:hypothetical protein n=1 Tax=Sphingomonas sp. ASV193 TaxID=3144405 RepID=UPI0032E897BD
MKRLLFAASAATFCVSAPALAQAADPAPTDQIPAKESVSMPKLDFAPSPQAEQDFDKYFYFHRDDTSFEQAYADIRECDALASGSSIYLGASDGAVAGAMATYGVLAGAAGGMIGSLVGDAIFGSAARRQARRINLRNCMGFKGYQRFGLPRELWTAFNFEEGLGRKREPVRLKALATQALVASGPAPTTKALGL